MYLNFQPCVVSNKQSRLERDDNKFRELYPETNLRINILAAANRKRHGKQRVSKNGTPEERASKSSTTGGENLGTHEK